jgi:hypothetical protein
MLSIAEYNPFFIKKTFNLPEYKPKHKRKVIIDYDPMFYAIFNKIHNYDVTHVNYVDYSKINEKQEKIKIATEIEKLEKNKLKSKDKDDIVQNLMYENKINLKTLNGLCMVYKINVLYIKDNIFINMNHGSSDALYLENNRIIDPIDISSKYEVNLDKPLRCASYYKIDDLRQISTQLHLPIENIKKQQLYDSIHNVLTKLNI